MEQPQFEGLFSLMKEIMICIDQFQYLVKKENAGFVLKKIQKYKKTAGKRKIIPSLSLLSEIFRSSQYDYFKELDSYRAHYFTSERLNDSVPYLELILSTMKDQLLLINTKSLTTPSSIDQGMKELKSPFYFQMNILLMDDENKRNQCFALCRFIWKDETQYALEIRMKLLSKPLNEATTLIDEAFQAYFGDFAEPLGRVFRSELFEQIANGISKCTFFPEVLKLLEAMEEKEPYSLSEEKQKERREILDYWLITKEEAQREQQKYADELIKQEKDEKQKEKENKERKLIKAQLAKEEKEQKKEEEERQQQQKSEAVRQKQQSDEAERKQREKEKGKAQRNKQSEKESSSSIQDEDDEKKRDRKMLALLNDNEASQNKKSNVSDSMLSNVPVNQSKIIKAMESDEPKGENLAKQLQDLEIKYQALQAEQLKQKDEIKQMEIRMEAKFFQFLEQQQKEQVNVVKNVQGVVNQATSERFNTYLIQEAKLLVEARKEIALKTQFENTLKAHLRLPLIRSFCKGLFVKYKHLYANEDDYDSYEALKKAIVNAYPNQPQEKKDTVNKALESCIKLIHGISEFVHQRNEPSKKIKFDVDTADDKDQYIQDTPQQLLSSLQEEELVKSNLLQTKEIDIKSIIAAVLEVKGNVDELINMSNLYRFKMK